jgi:xanthine dehydrogenase small subunit
LLEREPTATVVAGSTDVGLWVTRDMREISPVIFIGDLTELKRIAITDSAIEIGAGVTYTEAFDTLGRFFPALAALVDRIGGEQIRNMGTIGGNIANGSPIGDMPPALIALSTTLTLRRGRMQRTMLLEDFFIDYGKQDRRAGEFVERIEIPLPQSEEHFAVYKVSKRPYEDITSSLGAFNLRLSENNKVTSIRIAYGGMAATPKRAAGVEAALLGRNWAEATIEEACAAYAKDFAPLTDMRASAAYRALVAQNLLRRFYSETQNDGASPSTLR